MKEFPIIFSASMVRAILEGRKTQTRRVVKPQPYKQCQQLLPHGDEWLQVLLDGEGEEFVLGNVQQRSKCPYGIPGDRLYVKEATWLWCERRPNGTTKTGRQKWHFVPVPNTPAIYCAGHAAKPDWSYPVVTSSGNIQMWKYKSGRFMPRWASRITLEIAEVRVQRVQEISEEDCRAEGIDTSVVNPSPRGVAPIYPKQYGSAKDCFRDLWDSINAERGFPWASNPWVWAISFKRV